MRYIRSTIRLLATVAFLIGLVLSPNVYLALKTLRLAAEGAFAEIRLAAIPPERYAAEIGAALDAGDATLARSLAGLAADRNIAIPDELTTRIAALPAFDLGHALGEGWNCLVHGDFDSEAGFACVVATDMSGVGDVRDLVGEGGKFIAGQPLDYFTLGLASVGLTLSASTYASLGGALPLRAGASFVKAMHRVGKLPPKLTNEIGTALARSINRPALDEALALAGRVQLDQLHRPLARLFNPRSLARVSDLATDFGAIGKAGGVRAMKLSAGVAESGREVKLLARTADRFQDRFVGVMKLAGRGVLGIADLLLTLSGWLVGAVLWVWGMASFLLGTITRGVRVIGRMLRPLVA